MEVQGYLDNTIIQIILPVILLYHREIVLVYSPYTLATINSTQTFTNKTINNGNFTGNTTFNDQIILKETHTSLGSWKCYFYHPNNSGNTRLFGLILTQVMRPQ